MNNHEHDLNEILLRADQDLWDHPIPQVSMKLKLAINSLGRHGCNPWNMSPEELLRAMEQNHDAQEIFSRSSNNALAYAIRLARMAS